jgi:hypothetical protein
MFPTRVVLAAGPQDQAFPVLATRSMCGWSGSDAPDPGWLCLSHAREHLAHPRRSYPLGVTRRARRTPVEKVWWRLNGQIAANRLQGSIDVVDVAIHDFFATFTSEDALQLVS